MTEVFGKSESLKSERSNQKRLRGMGSRGTRPVSAGGRAGVRTLSRAGPAKPIFMPWGRKDGNPTRPIGSAPAVALPPVR
jgi:hypothetical protein